MRTISNTLARTAIGTAAIGAMALTSASPAFARDRYDNNRVDTGDIIAGALVLGGIAAVAAATDNNNDRRYRNDYNYRNTNYRGYNQYNSNRYKRRGPRAAVERCVRAVERDARRAGYRYANVTEIRNVERERGGWEVKGRLVVDGNRGYGRYNTDYDYADNGRYRNNGQSRYYKPSARNDRGRFVCDTSRGSVVNINYRGLRRLR